MSRRDRSGAGFNFGDDAGGHGGPDDVVAAVVLAADAVQGLDVDGAGDADGRLQFRAAGNGMMIHLLPLDDGYSAKKSSRIRQLTPSSSPMEQ